MRWLWKDWPAPVKAGAGSPQLQEILIPGEGWTLVAEGYRFTEGPAANAQGEVFFNDIPNSKTYKIGLDGKVSPLLADTKQANGQAFGPDGRLYAAAGADEILAYDAERQADGHRRGIPRQRPGRPPRRRHLRDQPRPRRRRAEQGLVHQPQGREAGRRHRA